MILADARSASKLERGGMSLSRAHRVIALVYADARPKRAGMRRGKGDAREERKRKWTTAKWNRRGAQIETRESEEREREVGSCEERRAAREKGGKEYGGDREGRQTRGKINEKQQKSDGGWGRRAEKNSGGR